MEEANQNTAPVQVSALALTILCLISGLLAVSAIKERLSQDEARFLSSVIAEGDAGLFPAKIQHAWSHVVGLMERPSRLLGLLSAFVGLFATLLVVRDGHGKQSGAVVAAAAWSPVLMGAYTIGGSAPMFCAVGLLILLVSKTLTLSLRSLAHLSLFLILAASLVIPGPETNAIDWHTLLALGPDLTAWGLPSWCGALLVGITLIGTLAAIGELLGLVLFVLVLAAGPFAQNFDLSAAPLPWIASAFGVPFALYVAAQRTSSASQKLVTPLITLMLLVTLSWAGSAFFGSTSPQQDRDRLDWIAQSVPNQSWVVLSGERNEIIRYYEQSGHRTGHRSVLITDPSDLKNVIRVALTEKPPTICFVDTSRKDLEKLLSRYVLLENAELPQGVTIAKFKRRG